MTLTLHLGVTDIPYVERETPGRMAKRVAKHNAKPRAKKTQPAASEKTTGDVATILEAKYGLQEAFFENNEIAIAGFLEDGLANALEDLMSGSAPTTLDPFGEGTSNIEALFRTFLITFEAEKVGIEGTPTMAARKGINHRFKHPYAKANPRRPSFVDTGLMVASFKAWID